MDPFDFLKYLMSH